MTTGHVSVGKAITYNKKKCLADNRTAKYEASGGPVENLPPIRSDSPSNFKNSGRISCHKTNDQNLTFHCCIV